MKFLRYGCHWVQFVLLTFPNTMTQSKTVIRYCPDKTVVTIIDRTRKIKTVGQMRTQREEKEAPNKPFSIRVSVILARFANRIVPLSRISRQSQLFIMNRSAGNPATDDAMLPFESQNTVTAFFDICLGRVTEDARLKAWRTVGRALFSRLLECGGVVNSSAWSYRLNEISLI